MAKSVLNILVREADEEGLGTYSLVDMIQHHLPNEGYIPEGKERDKLRKDILKDVSRCLDLLLNGSADDIRIERDLR